MDKERGLTMTDKNSLIKSFHVESVEGIARNKVTFIVVNDRKLVYYTNSEKFLDNLKKFEGQSFIIEYAYSEFSTPKPTPKTPIKVGTGKKAFTEPEPVDTSVETKIVRVKLPRIKRA